VQLPVDGVAPGGRLKCGGCGEILQRPAAALDAPAAEPAPAKEPDDTLVGREIGGYQLLERITEDATGKVYRALQTAMRRTVILKVLADAVTRQPDALQRFWQETRAAAKLNHPGLISIYDMGETGGLNFISMEYVEGRPLSAVLEEQGALPMGLALSICAQFADALDYAIRAGVRQVTLRLNQILLTDLGQIKIYGLSVRPDPRSVEETTAEAVRLVGGLLYHLIMGKPPQMQQVELGKRKHLTLAPLSRENPDVPDSVDVAVRKAFRADRVTGYQSLPEFRDRLEKLVSTVGTAAPKAEPAPATEARTRARLVAPQPGWKPQTILIGAGALAVCLIVAVIIILTNPEGDAFEQAQRRAEAYRVQGRYGDALTVYAKFSQEYPRTSYRRELIANKNVLVRAFNDGYREASGRRGQLIKQGRYQAAVKAWDQFLRSLGDPPEPQRGLLQGTRAGVAQEIRKAFNDLKKKADGLAAGGKTDEAIQLYQRVVDKSGMPEMIDQARQRIEQLQKQS